MYGTMPNAHIVFIIFGEDYMCIIICGIYLIFNYSPTELGTDGVYILFDKIFWKTQFCPYITIIELETIASSLNRHGTYFLCGTLDFNLISILDNIAITSIFPILEFGEMENKDTEFFSL